MNVGEIYFFISDKAKGYDRRPKFHVYMCEAGWRDDGAAFLFISSSNYGCDYKIAREDYPFLTKDESFVSCGNIVTYTQEKLNALGPQLIGKLKELHLKELHTAILDSETMEEWQIKLCCDAISKT